MAQYITHIKQPPTTKYYSEFLSSVIYISGLEALEDAAINKLFICLDSEVDMYLNRIVDNLKNSCVISYKVQTEKHFTLTSDTLKSNSAFLALELQPFLQKHTKTPLTTTLVGEQFDAIIAAYTATSFETTVQAVLSLSGSYYWKPEEEKKWEWFTQWLTGETHCPTHMYLLSSIKQTFQPPKTVPTAHIANEHLYDVLQTKSCNVSLREFSASKLSDEFYKEIQIGCEWLIEHLDAR